jgi:hypothetical protein
VAHVRNYGSKRKMAPKGKWSRGPAGPAKSLITGKILSPAPKPSEKSRLEVRFDAIERLYAI